MTTFLQHINKIPKTHLPFSADNGKPEPGHHHGAANLGHHVGMWAVSSHILFLSDPKSPKSAVMLVEIISFLFTLYNRHRLFNRIYNCPFHSLSRIYRRLLTVLPMFLRQLDLCSLLLFIRRQYICTVDMDEYNFPFVK